MSHHNLLFSKEQLFKIKRIQKFQLKRLRNKWTLRKVKVLSKFKANLLAVFKGWIVRSKIFKNPYIKNSIKDLKLLQMKYQQSQNQTSTGKTILKTGLNINKAQIKEKVQLLITYINNMISNKSYIGNLRSSVLATDKR